MKMRTLASAVALAAALTATTAAHAGLYINEIYFDPPGSLDSTTEYIELRGTPNMSLANYSLIFLENENNATNTGSAGEIDHIFNLGAYSIGSNGFLTMRQKSNPYSVPATGTTNLVNTATGLYSAGWGSGAGSTIGASQQGNTGIIENSGFTAMLVCNNGGSSYAPYLGQDLDQGNNGLDAAGSDVNAWRSNWTVVDSIGILSEFGEALYGRVYGNINFGPEVTTNIESGAAYVSTNFEIEYIGRWGNSTGQTALDWNVSNLTDNAASGYTTAPDYRQSGSAHPIGGVFSPSFRLESTHGIAYGTPLLRTLGAQNYYALAGDADQNGTVNSTDLGLLLSHYNQSAVNSPAPWAMGDFDCNGTVNSTDLGLLLSHYNQTASVTSAVPEPASVVLLAIVGLALAGLGLRRLP